MDSKFRFKFYRMMPLNKNIFSNCLIIVFTIILSFSSKAQLTLSNTYANIICNGATTEDTLLASGGSSPYLFKVNEGAFSTNDIYSLTAGTYTFTVQDALSASATLIVTINQPSPVAANTLFTPPFCFGESNGSATGIGSGGISYNGILGATTDYIYEWYDVNFTQLSANDSVLENITAGTYNLVVEDFNGCRDTANNVIVTQPSLVVGNINSTLPSCFGASNGELIAAAVGGISFNGITGATSDYIYDWYDNVYNQIIFNDSVLSDISSGQYHVVIEDYNGCRDTLSPILNQPNQLAGIITNTPPYCFGESNGMLTAVGSGGTTYNGVPGANFDYIYDWYDSVYDQILFNDSVLNNIPAGNYHLVLEDFNGCRDTISSTLTQPNKLNVLVSFTSPLCFGGNTGSAMAAASGGISYNGVQGATSDYIYDWYDNVYNQLVFNDSNLTNIISGSYFIGVEDFNGCRDTAMITVTEPPLLVASSAVSSPILCNGGNAVVAVSAIGGTPAYSNIGDNTVTAGTYNYTVTDANGCTATTSITISEPTVLVASSAITSPVLCNGGNALVAVSAAGGTPAYSNIGDNTVTAGTYNYTVIDANGCTAATSIIVNEPTELIISAIVTQPHCFGDLGSVVLSASGATPAYTYSSGAITNLAAGIYTYTVTDANACSISTSVSINQAPPKISVGITTSNTVINAATNLALTASAAVPVSNYVWTSPSHPNFTGNPLLFVAYVQDEGIYTVVATDAIGCTESATIEIYVNNGIKLNLKALLSGPLTSSGLMHDALRQSGLIPNSDPYALNTSSNPYAPIFTHVNGGGEIVDPGVLSNAGNDAIVDWVFIQLRDKNNSTTVLYTRSALIQRDGDIVDMDGVSPVFFSNTTPDMYYVSLKHRNHLGIMGLNAYNLSLNPANIDFTNVNTPLFTNAAPNNNLGMAGVQTRIVGGKRALFAGNCNIALANAANRYLVFNNNTFSDRTSLFNYTGFAGAINGYSIFDLDLNGSATFNSLNPDRLVLLINCSNVTGLFVNEQTPN